MISGSSNINALNHRSSDFLVKSWNLSLGKVNLFWVKDGVIRATISRGDGKSSYISDILGLQKHWMSSSALLTHVLSDAYAILNQSSNREFFLRIAPRICGGGHGHSKDSSSEDRSDAGSSYSEKDISHDRRESARADKAADTKQTAEGAHERRNPSPSDFEQFSSKNTNPYTLGQAAMDVAEFIVGETTGIGIPAILTSKDLNQGEEEWLAHDRAQDFERRGISISDLREQVPERSSQDYAQDVDRREFDRSDYNRQEPPERSWQDYAQDVDRRGDMSDFRDNMREHAELYSNE